MQRTVGSILVSSLKVLQWVVRGTLWLAAFAFLAVSCLQLSHSAELDSQAYIVFLRKLTTPILTKVAPWVGSSWPSSSVSLVPLALVVIFGIASIPVNNAFEACLRWLGGAVVVKAARRRRCTLLSVEVVDSARLKREENKTALAFTFQAYEEMLKKVFRDLGAWKQTLTPDGALACFAGRDLAATAAEEILRGLPAFNENENKLAAPLSVRCGIYEDWVAISESSRLEKVVDKAIDAAIRVQKQAKANSLWVGAQIYGLLKDKSGFRPTGQSVGSSSVYEWTAQAAPAAAKTPPGARPAAAPAQGKGGMPQPGRYEVLQELGRGAMGAVYKARDPQIGRIVAIKFILLGSQSQEDLDQYKQRFYREAQTAGQMSHQGIVTIHDVAEDAMGQPYLVMEYIEGTSLDKVIEAPGQGARDLRRLLDIASQVADALDYAHRRKVIHRDIKPANILITAEGRAKIADFGIAKVGGTQMTQTGMLMGTPAYMSPEQISGGSVDTRSDLFSLGVVLYKMFTGTLPFDGATVTEVVLKVIQSPPPPMLDRSPNLPPQLVDIVSRCLAKKPEDRYQTARQLADDLEALKARLIAGASLPLPGTSPRA